MKKTLIITAIFLLAIIVKTAAQVVVYNYTCETVNVVFYAEDAASPPTPCGGWVSNSIAIPSGGFIGTNTEAWINGYGLGCPYSGGSATYPLGWASGPGALMPCYLTSYVPPLAPWGWDGAQVTNSGGTFMVGTSGCISSGSASTGTGDMCSGFPMTATWSVSALSGITLTITD